MDSVDACRHLCMHVPLIASIFVSMCVAGVAMHAICNVTKCLAMSNKRCTWRYEQMYPRNAKYVWVCVLGCMDECVMCNPALRCRLVPCNIMQYNIKNVMPHDETGCIFVCHMYYYVCLWIRRNECLYYEQYAMLCHDMDGEHGENMNVPMHASAIFITVDFVAMPHQVGANEASFQATPRHTKPFVTRSWSSALVPSHLRIKELAVSRPWLKCKYSNAQGWHERMECNQHRSKSGKRKLKHPGSQLLIVCK